MLAVNVVRNRRNIEDMNYSCQEEYDQAMSDQAAYEAEMDAAAAYEYEQSLEKGGKKMAEEQITNHQVSTSPIPTVAVEEAQKVNFYAALKGAVEGKKITKLEWNNVNVYLFFNTDTEHLTIHKDDGKNEDLIVRIIDVTGDDWVMLP